MSAQTDELDNIIASLTNVNAALKAADQQVPVAPEVPVVVPDEAEVPADGQVAVNTPSAPETPVEAPADVPAVG